MGCSKEHLVCLLHIVANFEIGLFHVAEFLGGGVEILYRVGEGRRQQRCTESVPGAIEKRDTIGKLVGVRPGVCGGV